MTLEPMDNSSENNPQSHGRRRLLILGILALAILVCLAIVSLESSKVNLDGSSGCQAPCPTQTASRTQRPPNPSLPSETPEASETPALSPPTAAPTNTPAPPLATSTLVLPSVTSTVEEASETPETPVGITLVPTVQGGVPSETPESPNTDTPVPASLIQIAAAPIVIRSTSGDVIGDGTVQVFAPQRIQGSETATIYLELHFDHQYITPTPFGARTAFPVTRVTSTAHPGEPTSTPRIPIHEEIGIDIYQRMGASLSCSGASFSGCDGGFSPVQIKLASVTGTTWLWFLSAKPGVIGKQDLRLQLWTVPQVGDQGEQQGNTLSDYPFQIDVVPSNVSNGQTGSAALILAIVAAIFVIVLIVFVVLRSRGATQTGGSMSRRAKPGAKVFISYRRADSWGLALKIRDTLQARGFDAFMDIHDIHEGQFVEIIKPPIQNPYT